MKKGASGKIGAPFFVLFGKIYFHVLYLKMEHGLFLRYNKVKFVIICMTSY
jgi:hypothetical protein